MSDIAIRVENLSKQYRIGRRQPYRTLRETITDFLDAPLRRFRPGKEDEAVRTFMALDNVSFEVKRGEVIGIIGRNGAGKSTLLKILSRITEPTGGRVEINGRVGSLLEVGTGFHPELTGRENVFLNGAILGMKRAEIAAKFDEIVEFAEISKFLDTAVKHYSSGMYMRLAFAVAAHLEPEILIVDEVLAVGDVQFQQKCMGRISEVAREGRTVLFVSHNMAAISGLCETAIYLESGRIGRNGTASQIVDFYLERVAPAALQAVPLVDRVDRTGTGRVRLTRLHLEDAQGRQRWAVASGSDLVIVLGYTAREPVHTDSVDVGISIHDAQERTLFVLYSSYTGKLLKAGQINGEFRCTIPRLPLSPGRFKIGGRVVVGGEESDWPRDGIGSFEVEAGDFYRTGQRGSDGDTAFLVDGRWTSE